VIVRKFFLLPVLFAIIGFNSLNAVEITKDRYVRLVLDDNTGSFLLYYLVDPENMTYEPLFNDKDPSASFSAVSVNGRIYRLGEARAFKTKIDTHDGNPVVIYESSSLLVTKTFYPLRTISSPNSNGIRISINIKNKSSEEIVVGYRELIDTHLGEGRGNIPFKTDNLSITRETLVDSISGENYWVSRGQNISLMGNITSPDSGTFKIPDFVHFANWKILNDVSWTAPFFDGRTFSYTHYSIGDSAVGYYYEPQTLGPKESFDYAIFLTTEDTAWYRESGIVNAKAREAEPAAEQPQLLPQVLFEPEQPVIPASVPIAKRSSFEGIQAVIDDAINEAEIYGEDTNKTILKRLQDTLDQFIAGEIELTEQDLLDVEMSIERYGNR